ncbi:MAG: Mannitol-1-phosphate 5-dehydrogenase [Candidatus Celerinatantimonas neptuna]|nr:MAG: Mannitol-1-phosphate 5-dehydrogenase [Candidatus Celerinatantimonas neptuna]
MKALHFGAGNIGRGFIGKLLSDTGFEVIFADVNQQLLDQINQQGRYIVNIVGDETRHEWVSGICAVNSSSEELLEKIAEVDLITTAVGPNILDKISPNIARGLSERFKRGNTNPLNIIACENMIRATTHLKEQVKTYLTEQENQTLDTQVGFIDSAVDRIVPPCLSDDPLAVTVEAFSEWIVDKTQFKGPIPDIEGMELTDNLMAFIERKLFTLNTGHIATAYLGALKNYQTILEAINDDTIRQQVQATMQESGEVLILRYGFEKTTHWKYIQKIINRFANPALNDNINRVGREPIRKLSATDRLIKPLMGTIEYNTGNKHLIRVIAAAFLYSNSKDPQAVELQSMLKERGVKDTLAYYTGLDVNSVEASRIEQEYQQFSNYHLSS